MDLPAPVLFGKVVGTVGIGTGGSVGGGSMKDDMYE